MKGKEGEREGEKQWSTASLTTLPGDLAHNSGMGPDWELNQWPLGLQTGAKPTEPYQPGTMWS